MNHPLALRTLADLHRAELRQGAVVRRLARLEGRRWETVMALRLAGNSH